MSQSITIPSDWGSVVRVNVNGRVYLYKAGQSVTVPDEVAEAIANRLAEDPVYGRVTLAPLAVEELYEGDDYIPVYVTPDGRLRIRMEDIAELVAEVALPQVDAEDAGKVLTVSEDGEWVAEDLPSDSSEVET